MPLTPGLFSVADVCQRWGINRRTLSRWMKGGVIPGTVEPIPYMVVGKRVKFSPAQVEFIEARMTRKARAPHGRWRT